ncbi:EamA family transporter [Plastoroseomonas arctica]|uniref:EamA family transporter n=1 Tax=Plastoroseomonas arctica TaxID=1509237 RepID=A0AAF1KU90_9PROT|nr:EamA family transporter [Plastoroseomonas arctica]MBR0655737.1 EamA family transporter [Plastoroseomonas arctica]
MSLWLAATLLAAFFQTWRTALQQRLRGQLSINGAGVVRYLYGVPVGFAILGAYLAVFGGALSSPNLWFLIYCAGGGLLQILGTNLLIMAFGFRGFAVGTAYAKTEAVQGAVLALILLGELLSAVSWLGIAICVSGTLYLSLAGRVGSLGEALRATIQPAALCGLSAGFCFALTSVVIKSATQSLVGPDIVLSAIETLVVTNAMQTVMQGSYLLVREPGQIRAVFSTWRDSAKVGALSACGSCCWFTGFALAPVALVRAVGQVEIIFTLLFSRFYLREAPTRSDIFGALAVVLGVVIVLVGR